MASLTLPAGVLPDDNAVTLYGPREPFYTVGIVGGGDVSRVEGVALTFSNSARIKGRGTLTFGDGTDIADIDWETVRFAPVYHLDDNVSWNLSRFVASSPREIRSGGKRSWSVEVHDLNLALERRKITTTYALDTGAVVTDEIKALLTLAGETNTAITDSTEVLNSPRVWLPEDGISFLDIANDLADAINYTSLTVNLDGQFEAAPNLIAADRPQTYAFLDGKTAIHRGDFEIERNLSDIPDQVIATARGAGDTDALVGIYPAGTYAYTVTVDTDATSQEAVDAFARRSWAARQGAPRVGTIEHLPVPLTQSQVVRFRSTSFDPTIDALFIVTETSTPDRATGLATSKLREVLS
jgi:hypothetical protein